jgi:thiamine-monophosphate kinase
MKVSKIGEFGLIGALSQITAQAKDKKSEAWRHLIVGIGDDAAVWKPANPFQMTTVDSLVQDIHFSLKLTTWEELGWKSLAVNISDIAAMGGIPHYALISLGLPGDTDVDDIIALYRGMLEAAQQFGLVIVGGDTVSSPFVFISVTVFGSAGNAEGKVLRRSAARPGDKIAVTGYLGSSSGGYQMLANNLRFKPSATKELRKAHLKPYPRVVEGQILVEKGVKAGMDISDGLVGDLTHICEMSKVGARIEIDSVPVSPTLKNCFGERSIELALGGGEDYELLFTARPRIMAQVKKVLSCPVTVIGEITKENVGKVVTIDNTGKPVNLEKTGWDHFLKKQHL